MRAKFIFFILVNFVCVTSNAQEFSVARQWDEVVLQAIRNDNARPTIHARNLFHIHAAMYDAWALFDDNAKTYLIGQELNGFTSNFNGIVAPSDIQVAQEKAISYAAYRLIVNRYQFSPNWINTLTMANFVMVGLGYNTSITSTDYSDGDPAKLGNYIAAQYIAYGNQDGSNQLFNYTNQYYVPVNSPLQPVFPGNPNISNINRWQPLNLANFVDQNGFPGLPTPAALSPEWGNVKPFSLTESDKTVYFRDGNFWNVYKDPGPPPVFLPGDTASLDHPFVWGNVMVVTWSSHLSPDDTTIMDISPAGVCNVLAYPETVNDYPQFYDLLGGGDNGLGRPTNPVTGEPYTPQMVKRGDFTRVLAEFWADGPSSETPPGHWFKILNYVSDHPLFVKKWNGQGDVLSDLEWDVRSYFALGGAMHDAAICAWGIKGYYDGSRPVSVIRKMADNGQSSDPSLPNYHPQGLPLIPGYIELVQPGDLMNGFMSGDIGQVKIRTWKGPNYIPNPVNTYAGVDWILAKNWWPYQRPSFVSPPFAGYVSGHSTYSRTAAELMTLVTGSQFFPGGMGEFHADMNQYLVFEEGPSTDINLQWASYMDAADQCSLSRIWGGIHAPFDDIPGRKIGMEVGPQAFEYADAIQTALTPHVVNVTFSDPIISSSDIGSNVSAFFHFNRPMSTSTLPTVSFVSIDLAALGILSQTNSFWVNDSIFVVDYLVNQAYQQYSGVNFRVIGGKAIDGCIARAFIGGSWKVDMLRPEVTAAVSSIQWVTDETAAIGSFEVNLYFNKTMNTNFPALLSFTDQVPSGISQNNMDGYWSNASTYHAVFNVADNNEEWVNIALHSLTASDLAGNLQIEDTLLDVFSIDTRNPLASVSSSNNIINDALAGQPFQLNFVFDEEVNTSEMPAVSFVEGDPTLSSLGLVSSMWNSATNYVVDYLVNDSGELFPALTPEITAHDIHGNEAVVIESSVFMIDTENPTVVQIVPSTSLYEGLTSDFYIDVVYSEAMSGVTAPTLTFADPFVLDYFTQTGATWIDATTYRFTYTLTLLDAPFTSMNLSVTLANGFDVYDNPFETSDFTDVLSIDIVGSVSESALNAIHVFPNPSSDIVIVEGIHSMLNVTVRDEVGRIIHAGKSASRIELNVSNWASGIYLMEFNDGKGLKQVRFIKK
ncbi:MAG: hypothetical protein RJA38_764 [Bacteroidota bacterium]|jgi:hypothetical protein